MDRKTLIGQRVRAARLERGLTQEQLAERVERSVDTVSNLERGVSLPSHATLERVSRCLGLSIDEILGPTPDTPDKRSAALLFRLYELAKTLDHHDLALAYDILKAIATRART